MVSFHSYVSLPEGTSYLLLPMESITINGQSAAMLTDLDGPQDKKEKKKNSTGIGQHSLKAENRIQKLIHHGFREIPTGLPFRSPWRLFLCNLGQLILGAANPLGNHVGS